MSNIRMRQVAYMNESWHTYVLQENRAVLHENRALIYLSVSHVADVDEACHTYE